VRGAASQGGERVVNVVSFEAEASPALHLMLRERRVRAESLRAAIDPSDEDLETLQDVLSTQPDRALVIVTRRAHLHERQARAVDTLLASYPDAVLVSAREPFDVARFPEARNVLCTYGDEPVVLEALAEVLAGRSKPVGRLPVRLRETAA